MKKVKLTKEQREELSRLFKHSRKMEAGLIVTQEAAGDAAMQAWEAVHKFFPDITGRELKWRPVEEELLIGEPDSTKESP
jgi:hypothetical protein